jgi:hypothetical protein
MNNINDLKQSIRDLSDLYIALLNKSNNYFKNNLYKLNNDFNEHFIFSIHRLQYIIFNLTKNANDMISPLCNDALEHLNVIDLPYSSWGNMNLAQYKLDYGISAENIIQKNANAVENAKTIVTQLKDKFQDVAVDLEDAKQETTAGGSRMRRRMRKSRKTRKTRRR